MSARTLRDGASVGSAPFRTTLKGPNSRTATERRDATRTSLESHASSHARLPDTYSEKYWKAMTQITLRTMRTNSPEFPAVIISSPHAIICAGGDFLAARPRLGALDRGGRVIARDG